jgi:hypothetical protein
MRAKIAAAVIAAALAGAPLLAAAPASAAVATSHVIAGASTPDFTPSSSGVKKLMVNVLGKVLGKATPKSWQAEQIANQYQYNHSWEQLGVAVNGAPSWNPAVPQSYDDYQLLAAEQQFSDAQKTKFTDLTGTSTTPGKGGTAGSVFSIPATKPGVLGKAIGGAGAAVTAISGYQFGASLGHGIAQVIGIDPDGLVCSSGASGLLSVVTGVSCAQFDNALSTDQQNSDVSVGLGGTLALADGGTLSLTGTLGSLFSVGSTTAKANAIACATVSGVSGVTHEGAYIVLREGFADTVGYYTASAAGGGATCDGIAFANGSAGSYQDTFPQHSQAEIVAAAQAGAMGANLLCLSRSAQSCLGTVSGAITKTPSDPERQLVCSIAGDDGQVYQATSDSFRESDSTFPAPKCPALPDGVHASTVTISEDGGGQHNVLSTQAVTDEYQKQTSEFPGCDQGACELLLLQKQPDSTYRDCTDLGDGCKTWFTDAAKADDYRCTYGGKTVDLDECNLYAGIFDPARVAAGAPYSDPITGQWSGGQNAPDESQQAYGTQVQDPTAPRTCDNTTASGFDPIAWVMKPVQCAMEWAFVPEPMRVKVDMTQASQSWSDTLPAEAVTMVGSWSPTASNTGCKIPVSFTLPPILGGQDIHFDAVNACDGPMANLATISQVATSAVVIVAAAFAVRRAFAASVGYHGGGND